MKLEAKDQCPLNNFEPCRKFDCAWFTPIRGQNPNTGEQIDDWACAIKWLPVLLIETASQSRQTGAAVESFRNEMVVAHEETKKLSAEIGKTNNAVAQILGSMVRAAALRNQNNKELPR